MNQEELLKERTVFEKQKSECIAKFNQAVGAINVIDKLIKGIVKGVEPNKDDQ